jgi:hypothetical protein
MIAACEQRLHCRIGRAMLVFDPQLFRPLRNAPNDRMHETSMKQFLTSQDASTTRTAAADAVRRDCAELLS